MHIVTQHSTAQHGAALQEHKSVVSISKRLNHLRNRLAADLPLLPPMLPLPQILLLLLQLLLRRLCTLTWVVWCRSVDLPTAGQAPLGHLLS